MQRFEARNGGSSSHDGGKAIWPRHRFEERNGGSSGHDGGNGRWPGQRFEECYGGPRRQPEDGNGASSSHDAASNEAPIRADEQMRSHHHSIAWSPRGLSLLCSCSNAHRGHFGSASVALRKLDNLGHGRRVAWLLGGLWHGLLRVDARLSCAKWWPHMFT